MIPPLDDLHEDLLRHWRGLVPSGDAIPPRSALDPLDVPRHLSSLILTEVVENDIRFRLVGTDMVEAWGADFTGEFLSDIMSGDYHDFIHGLFFACVEHKAPVVSRSRFQWDRGRTVDTVRLMLPFSATDAPNNVAFVLVCQLFDYERAGPVRPSVRTLRDGHFEEISRMILTV
jgi:hypothetical protein